MQLIMFTKHLEGLDVLGLIEALQTAGVDGADLCVRPGYPVNPENMATALPAAAKQFAAAGLSIPLVTTPGSLTHPDTDEVERFYAACGEAGVRHIKLGYWRWQSGMDYWAEVDKIRGWLGTFQELSAKTGVQTVVHTHSSTFMGLNASAVMTLVRDCDPKHVGVFLDPGHLAIDGEPIDMALNIVESHLSLMAFKDFVLERVWKDGTLHMTKAVRKLGWGMVDWQTTLTTLRAMDFRGPVSIHSEYHEPVETVVDLARADTRFVRALLAEIDGA